jgi:hypothetical protein
VWLPWVLGVAAGLVPALGTSGPARAETPWDLLPYQVELWIGAVDDPAAARALSAQWIQELAKDLDHRIAPLWKYSIQLLPTKEGIQFLRDGVLPERSWPETWRQVEHPDKAIVVTIGRDSSGRFLLSSREFDVRSRSWGPRVVRRAPIATLVSQALFEVVWEAFCPNARLVTLDLETKRAELQVRGVALKARDPALQVVSEGQVFRPWIRYNDRLGRPVRINDIPFTFLRVEAVNQPLVSARLHTAFRSPLSARRRGRVEQLLVATRPYLESTRLLLRDRTQPQQPLRGYQLYQQSPGIEKTRFLGVSNDVGAVLVPASSDTLQILWIKNGQLPLARLPLVPGSVDEIAAELPNDDERLEAEAYVLGLQEELLELVTRRQILMARINRLLAEGQRDRARQLLEQLRALPTVDQFRRHLLLNRRRLISPDPLTQKRIDQMFAKTEELIKSYLDPEPIEALAARVAGR